MTTSACPNYGTLNTLFFGDLFAVQTIRGEASQPLATATFELPRKRVGVDTIIFCTRAQSPSALALE